MSANILPVFTQVPKDWEGRWELIRQLTYRWQNIPLVGVGNSEGNENFPPTVREWLAFVKYVRSLDLDSKLVDSMKSAEFTFDFAENEIFEFIPLLSDDGGRSIYVVPKGFSAQEDPVVHFYDATSEEDCGLNRKSVTMFALSWVLQFSVGYDGSGDLPKKVEIDDDTAKKAVAFLKKNISKPSKFDDFEIFEKENLFVALEPALRDAGEADGKYIYVFGRGNDAEELISKIPGVE